MPPVVPATPSAPQTMRLIDPDGITRDVSLDAAPALLQDTRWRVPTAEDTASRLSEQAKEETYGGVGGAIKAGLAAGARGATLGLSDVGARLLGGDDTAIDLEGLREAHPYVSGASEFAGALAPALISGGAALPAGAAARVGGAVARAGEGALGRIGGAALGGAAEGALFGAGQGVSELALSQDPLTVERIGSALGSNMLYGAGVGVVAGAATKGLELGLRQAKRSIDSALERRAVKAATPEEAIRTGDLQGIDKRILDTAERSEIERISAERAPEREALTSELDAWRRANRDADDIRAITKSAAKTLGDRNLSEASGAFDRANFELRKALDDKVGFAEDPTTSIKAVRKQGQALGDILTSARAVEQTWRDAVDTAPQRFRAALEEISSKPTLAERTKMARKLGLSDYTGPFTPAGLDNATERAIKEFSTYHYAGAVKNGLKEPSIVGRIRDIEGMLETNQRLQTQLEALAKPPTSELLIKIGEAREVLAAPKTPSLGGALVSAAAPFAGPVAAAAAAGTKVMGSFKKVAAAAAARAGKAASSILGTAEKAAGKAAPYAPVLATKTLASVRYAADDDGGKKRAPAGATLPDLFDARAGEVRSQVAVAPDGSYQMRPEARAKMASRFDGIRPADPVLADQLEELGARRLEYLATIMPRLPDYGAMPGATQPKLSDLAMRSWARSAAALEDPHGVFARAVDGHVTFEDAAAIQHVYPELLGHYLSQVGQGVSERKKPLRFAQRLALSILSGEPHDPALTPQVLSILQGSFANDEGRAATQAPMPMPAFGSVKKSAPEPTPSQRRAQGHA